MSHRKLDGELILGIKDKLEREYNYTVYIDWIDNPNLDRENVDKTTANTLRLKMQKSKCLIYVYSKKSTESKWMPWELGYMDGAKKNKCTILSIIPSRSNIAPNYNEQEYLNIYPPISEEGGEYYSPTNKKLLVYENGRKIPFDEWLKRNKTMLYE